MATPYWGALPKGPSTARRVSGDDQVLNDQPPLNHMDPFSSSSAPQQQPRRDRASVQTARTGYTEAPTESTLSPFVSPTRSSFAPQGLAPRPPTLPYGSSEYADEFAEKRQRRRSLKNEEQIDRTVGPTPPAAPDVPRAPPVSYRQPYTQSVQPAGPLAPQRQNVPPVDIDDMEPEAYYKADGQQNYPRTERSQGASRPAGPPRDARHGRRKSSATNTVPLNGAGEALDSANQPTRIPTGRKVSTDIRSPLQHLETVLSKEEKRARMEAAEQRVRAKANADPKLLQPIAQRTQPRQPRPQPQQALVQQPQQVRFSNDRDPDIYEDTPPRGPPQVNAVAAAPAAAGSRGYLPQSAPEDGKYQSTASQQNRRPSEPAYPDVHQTQEHNSGIPQRNLSFRDRAQKDDLRLPSSNLRNQNEASPLSMPPVTTPGGGFSLTRTGSNKLKKEKPGDPWFRVRQQAEQQYSNADTRNLAMDRSAAAIGGSAGSVQRSGSLQGQQYPRDPSIPSEQVERAGVPIRRQSFDQYEVPQREPVPVDGAPAVALQTGRYADARRQRRNEDSDYNSSDDERGHHVSNMIYRKKEHMSPGRGLYLPPQWLNEWQKSTTGLLGGSLLDLSQEQLPVIDKTTPWWEGDNTRRRSSVNSRPRKAEAFDGEYDETTAPTRFKPSLHLKCGPLLRYCGIRHEKGLVGRSTKAAPADREIWRGTVMIVTQDSQSSYEISPTLRLFVQPIELLPPPPHEISGEQPLAPEDETDEGLFETLRSPPDYPVAEGAVDLSYTSRRARAKLDGERASKYKDVRGFRLHAERGYTFWRFNIEVELGAKQQRIAYRINRGPALGFWVPAKGQSMNIMFHSCNGFSMSVNPNDLSGPDPMWRDVLNNHQTNPFHVMIGGGDQVYNDCLIGQSDLFNDWLDIRNPLQKHNAPFTPAMQNELESLYLERYCMWFSQGLFGLANSQIPMINMWDDHDISDGYGSYPHHDQNSPCFSGLGAVAFKYYMLFQHQSIPVETPSTEPSWLLGEKPGPYINELSRSLFTSLGSKVALLAVDARTERTEDDVISEGSWKLIMDRCYAEVKSGTTEHLLVLLGVPIAYPRMVWLENILTSRIMDPVKAMGKLGLLGNALNRIDGGVEVLDDLNDHWTARNHKKERSVVIEDLQDLAADKSVRITILSGDVHLAAVGQFYTNPKISLPKHKDFRYMPNIISSAIANTPPPNMLADVLNKRNKVHHFDENTDESMIPMFSHGVDGKPRNNKHLLPHRNWCSIREWKPGMTPPPTPPLSNHDGSPSSPLARKDSNGGVMRRLTKTRGPQYRPDAPQQRESRPPITGEKSGGLFRSPRKFFNRRPSISRPDDGGINGQWGQADGEADFYQYDDPRRPPSPPRQQRGLVLRGGGRPQFDDRHDEFQPGDEDYFTARAPPRPPKPPHQQQLYPQGYQEDAPPEPPVPIRPFHRTPTGLRRNQTGKGVAGAHDIDLEGGLDICLNVEVNPRDPAGITVPYRLLVPRLFWEDSKDETPPVVQQPAPSAFKRLLSFRKKQQTGGGPVSPQQSSSVPASQEYLGGRGDGGQWGPVARGPQPPAQQHYHHQAPPPQQQQQQQYGQPVQRQHHHHTSQQQQPMMTRAGLSQPSSSRAGGFPQAHVPPPQHFQTQPGSGKHDEIEYEEYYDTPDEDAGRSKRRYQGLVTRIEKTHD
ncbi:uncharacterized protein VDAG_01044 [Verticillium dahliae VdLs.17]|uniref:PhoD-like phosphatase domain-containing protein n=1 Tax=Verticillium dahliae (strain VdLs.17 / ATCC MYA-4575 / FGSC 10137) TaxID=498257 RepID=G2WTC1_VERDV|nr:uncharacterized protein VDAG_01044 [Verticillium dahliae VdLs.17]EGY17362.1 hypothetical protein VDAG_01044 [Verticillium dahliae VdLs.17]